MIWSLCSLVAVTSGFLWPFVSWCWSSCASSRLALDDAIRHKQLNISSRFSPRVAGENDFLQTVINKVIAAKEVNHKGQGTYCSLSMLVYVKLLIASSAAWDYYKFGIRSVFFGTRKYLHCSPSFRLILLFLPCAFCPSVSIPQTQSFLCSVHHSDTSVFVG